MAFLMQSKSPDEIKKMGVTELRGYSNKISETYSKIVNGDFLFCHKCNSHISSTTSFYPDERFASGYYPICKKCLLEMATDYDKVRNLYVDNKEKTIEVFRMLDIPFIESTYETALQAIQQGVGEKNRGTAYQQLLTIVKSLPNYRGKTFKHSEYINQMDDLDENGNSKTLEIARERFGEGYTNNELLRLERDYEDLIAMYPCETLAQEMLFTQVASTKLDIERARQLKKDTKDLLKTLQELFTSLGIKPNQSNANALTEQKTFGQLIDKWEETKPIAEPEDDSKDIDKIGLYIDVFFKGHLAHMMNIKNGLSNIYHTFIKKYAVTREDIEEEDDTDEIFEKLFGTKIDDF